MNNKASDIVLPVSGSRCTRRYQSWSHSNGVSHDLEPRAESKAVPSSIPRCEREWRCPIIYHLLSFADTYETVPSLRPCPDSILYRFHPGAAPLRSSSEPQLPWGKQEGEWAYGFICCLHQKESSN